MRSFTCVSVVACVARKLRPCPRYSRRRDRINLGFWRSLCKGGGGVQCKPYTTTMLCVWLMRFQYFANCYYSNIVTGKYKCPKMLNFPFSSLFVCIFCAGKKAISV